MFNLIDLLLMLVVAWCIWMAVRRGFILSVLWLLSWITGLALAFWAGQPLSAQLIKYWPGLRAWSAPLAFIIILLVSGALFDVLLSYILRRVPRRVHGNPVNKALGVLPGLLNGYISVTFFSALLLLLPINDNLSRQTKQSRIVRALSPDRGWLGSRLNPAFGALVNLTTVPVESGEKRVKLPFTLSDAPARPDLEKEMLRLVNKERVGRGLAPLKDDPKMTLVARAHSADMLARGYFSHYTPEGLDPFGRMKAAHLYFLTAGENIAITQTLLLAHTGLMHSPGHRANILNPAFGRLGIGILNAGIRGIMITQDFRN